MLACLGLSVISDSSERLVVTLALYVVLSLKATREEEMLEAVHGEAFAAWAAGVPRLVPEPQALLTIGSVLRPGAK